MLGQDKICAVVAAADSRSMRKQLVRALRQTRTVELRLDWLRDDREIIQFVAWLAAKRPQAALIATCRRLEAGGRYRGAIAKQLIHLADAIRAGCAWYDLEIETVRRCPPELLDVLLGDARQLTSAHFFRGMRANLSRTAESSSTSVRGGGTPSPCPWAMWPCPPDSWRCAESGPSSTPLSRTPPRPAR